jgi:hypothetical protein
MPNNALMTISSRQLLRAASIRERIEALEKELATVLGSAGEVDRAGASTGPGGAAGTRKRELSPEGRARIVAALKRRWAAQRAGKPSTPKASKAAGSRRTMSEATRAKLAAAARRRWKQSKAEGKSTL